MAGTNYEEDKWSDDEPPLLDDGEAEQAEVTGVSQKGAPANNQCNDSEAEAEVSIMDEMVAVATQAKAAKRLQQEKERNDKGFGGGLKKGFFNQRRSTKEKKMNAATGTLASPQRLEISKSTVTKKKEDALRIVTQAATNQPSEEAKSEASPFVFPEVQEALKSMNQLNPNDWMNERFFAKMAQNPKLLLALQNPRFTQAMSELQQNPQAAVLKYQRDPDVSLMLHDFMEFLGNHFEELGKEQGEDTTKKTPQAKLPVSAPSPPPAIVDLDETRRHAIATMERSPEEEEQVQRILQKPDLLAALSDAAFMNQLRECQQNPSVFQKLRSDPVFGPKLRLLVDAKMVTFA